MKIRDNFEFGIFCSLTSHSVFCVCIFQSSLAKSETIEEPSKKSELSVEIASEKQASIDKQENPEENVQKVEVVSNFTQTDLKSPTPPPQEEEKIVTPPEVEARETQVTIDYTY